MDVALPLCTARVSVASDREALSWWVSVTPLRREECESGPCACHAPGLHAGRA